MLSRAVCNLGGGGPDKRVKKRAMKTIRHRLLTLLLAMPAIGLSQAPELVTDRPDKTESSATVPKGSLQIETGVSIEADETFESYRVVTRTLPGTLFRLGIIDRVELRVGTEVTREVITPDFLPPMKTWRVAGLSVGTKIQLTKGQVQTAVIAEVGFPSGSTGYDGELEPVVIGCLAHDLGRVSFGYNVGMNALESTLFGSIAVGLGVGDKAGVFGEFYGSHDLSEVIEANAGANVLAFDAGFTYLLCSNLQIDVSFGTGITNRTNFFSSGVSWRIPE